MAKIMADGYKLIECGDEIVRLCEDYDKEIDELFNKLSKINQKAWSGNSASEYISRIRLQKSMYTTFGRDLKNYGKLIRNVGRNVNNVITKWEGR